MRRRSSPPSVLLGAVGMALVTIALTVVPGKESRTVETLIVVGAVFLALAILRPRLKRLVIKIKGVQAELESVDAQTRPELVAKGKRLSRFAALTCGDQKLGRKLVEDAMARTGLRGSHVLWDEHGRRTLEILVALLENVDAHRWIRRHRPHAWKGKQEERDMVAALGLLEARTRICFLLHTDILLRPEQIAEVLGTTVTDVRSRHSYALAQLRPLFDQANGNA